MSSLISHESSRKALLKPRGMEQEAKTDVIEIAERWTGKLYFYVADPVRMMFSSTRYPQVVGCRDKRGPLGTFAYFTVIWLQIHRHNGSGVLGKCLLVSNFPRRSTDFCILIGVRRPTLTTFRVGQDQHLTDSESQYRQCLDFTFCNSIL